VARTALARLVSSNGGVLTCGFAAFWGARRDVAVDDRAITNHDARHII
jgi:hypothetical protein